MAKRGSVQAKLIKNLICVGVVLAIILGAATLYVQLGKFEGEVVARTRLNIAHLETNMETLQNEAGKFDGEALHAMLASLRKKGRDNSFGYFVWLRITAPDGTNLFNDEERGYEKIDAVRQWAEGKEATGKSGESEAKTVIIDATPHVFVHMQLLDGDRGEAMQVEGVFAPSLEKLKARRTAAARSALLVGLVVLLTTLVLYPVILRLLKKVTGLSKDLLDSHIETLMVLGSAIAKRDSDTDIHNYRVTILAVRIAEAEGLEVETIRALIKGAFLHDVGKIGISDNILLKPGKLTDDEFTIMKRHVNYGDEIVRRSSWLQDALDVVDGHHEKVDGTGYPGGKVGDTIPVIARIFALADVFDALNSKRPYKDPIPFEKTMEIMLEGRGSHFDSTLFDTFAGIAPVCHKEISNRKDQELKGLLATTVRRYFAGEEELMPL